MDVKLKTRSTWQRLGVRAPRCWLGYVSGGVCCPGRMHQVHNPDRLLHVLHVPQNK